jgi:hypothetical protein
MVDVTLEFIIVLFHKATIWLFDNMKFAKNIEGVLQWDGTMQRFHYIDNSSLGSSYPIRKIHVVRDCGAKHDKTNMFWQHNNGFFPNHTSLLVIDVMHLIENDPLNVSDHLCAAIEIVPQDFSGHDHATRLGIHTHVSRDDPDRVKQF